MDPEDFLSRLKSKLQQKITSDSRGTHTFQNRYKTDKENIKYQRILNVKINGPTNNQSTTATTSSQCIVPTTLHLPPPIVFVPNPSLIVNETPEESILPIIKSENENETKEKSKPEEVTIKDEPKSDVEEFPVVKKPRRKKKTIKVKETLSLDLKATLLKNLRKITMATENDSQSLKNEKVTTKGLKRKGKLNVTSKKIRASNGQASIEAKSEATTESG